MLTGFLLQLIGIKRFRLFFQESALNVDVQILDDRLDEFDATCRKGSLLRLKGKKLW